MPQKPAPVTKPAQQQKQSRRECINSAIRKFLGKEAVTAIKREAAQVLAAGLTLTAIFFGREVAAAGAALQTKGSGLRFWDSLNGLRHAHVNDDVECV